MDKNETKNAWEIQKNGLKGNTTIRVVHYPMNLYGIINNLSENERNKAYEESSKAIINCLKTCSVQVHGYSTEHMFLDPSLTPL